MWFPSPTDLEPLPDLRIGDTDDLPQIRPNFFFSPLKEQPHDPILASIQRSQSKDAGIPKELAVLTADLGGLSSGALENENLSARSPIAFWSSVFDCQRQASVSSNLALYMGEGLIDVVCKEQHTLLGPTSSDSYE